MPTLKCTHCGGTLYSDQDDNLACRQCGRIHEYGPASSIREGMNVAQVPTPGRQSRKPKRYQYDG